MVDEKAWAQPQLDWARRRLLMVRLVTQHELTVAEIMKVEDVSADGVYYRDKVVPGGVAELLRREHAGGKSRWLGGDGASRSGWPQGSSGGRRTRKHGSRKGGVSA